MSALCQEDQTLDLCTHDQIQGSGYARLGQYVVIEAIQVGMSSKIIVFPKLCELGSY